MPVKLLRRRKLNNSNNSNLSRIDQCKETCTYGKERIHFLLKYKLMVIYINLKTDVTSYFNSKLFNLPDTKRDSSMNTNNHHIISSVYIFILYFLFMRHLSLPLQRICCTFQVLVTGKSIHATTYFTSVISL